MDILRESKIAENIRNEYRKFGYTQSVRNKILMFRSSERFGNILSMLDDDLLKKVFQEKAIKINYDIACHFNERQKLAWALRNGKKNLGKDEKKILAEHAHKENVRWAVWQYMRDFGEVNQDIMSPDGSGWGMNIEVQKSPYGEDLTAEEVIIKEMQQGGCYLEQYIDAATYFSKKVISNKLVDLVLQNNPSNAVVGTLLSCCYQEYEKRVELARVYAKTAESARQIIGFLNVERNTYFNLKSANNKFAHTIYEQGNEVYNELYQTALNRGDFFDGVSEEDIYKGVKQFINSWKNVSLISFPTLEKFTSVVVAKLRDNVYTKQILRYTLPDEILTNMILNAIGNNLKGDEIQSLINKSSYNAKEIEDVFVQLHWDKSWIDEKIKEYELAERVIDSKLFDVKVKQRITQKRAESES